MDQVTQQNAAMVEQSTAASHALAQESQDLVKLVGRFHIGERLAAREGTRRMRQSADVGRQTSPVVNDSTPASRSAVHQIQSRAAAFAQRYTAPAMKSTGSSAARKPETDDAGWEEF